MVGKQVEERVEFDDDIRRKVLMKTKFRCASCGEKLDMVRHTIDHIIPISRGGTNDMENLIGLCRMCNDYKSNLVYYPGDYYTYLRSTDMRLTSIIHRYVVNWLRNEVHNLNLHRYPIISPCSTAMLYLKWIRPKGYVRQLLFDIVYMDSHMRRANCRKVNFLKDYAYYAIIKRTTQNMFAIIRIDYSTDRCDPNGDGNYIAQLTVFDEWRSCNANIIAPLMRNISEVLASRYNDINIPLNEICIASTDMRVTSMIYSFCANATFMWADKELYICQGYGTLNDHEDLGEVPYFCVSIDEPKEGYIK